MTYFLVYVLVLQSALYKIITCDYYEAITWVKIPLFKMLIISKAGYPKKYQLTK